MAVSKRLAFLIALGIPLVLLTHWNSGAFFWLLVCLLVWLFDVIAAPPPPRHNALPTPHTASTHRNALHREREKSHQT